MLVLSRQINESIMIGDSIEITIVDIKGDKVRIGITAPKKVSVHRKEVYLAIQEENLAAAAGADLAALAQIGGMFPGGEGLPNVPFSPPLAPGESNSAASAADKGRQAGPGKDSSSKKQ